MRMSCHHHRRRLALLVLPALAPTLAGCGPNGRHLDIAIIDEAGALGRTNAADAANPLLRGATGAGLVGFDGEGRVVPALADRWIVTDDGLSYIFRLRDTTWPDGTALTGEGARAALIQAIANQVGKPLGLDLPPIEIRAMAGRVVELRLRQPMPDLLQLLAQPELGLLHNDKGWGPMRWQRDGAGAMLVPAAVAARADAGEGLAALSALRLNAGSAPAAVGAFAAGRADAVLGGSFADYALVANPPLGGAPARLDPVAGLFGLQVLRATGPLATAGAREAVAMAIDRDGLAVALAIPHWQPTTRIAAAGTSDDPGAIAERWPGEDIAARRAAAAARIASLPAAVRATVLRVALPAGPGADVLFAWLHDDLARIGLASARVALGAPAELRLVDRVERYDRLAWFLNQFDCGVLHGLPCSAAADALAAEARASADPAPLWAEAEATLTASNIYIPLGAPVRWSLVARRVRGFATNRWAAHPLARLAVQSR